MRVLWTCRPLAAVLCASLLAGCANLAPTYVRPQAPLPGDWPQTSSVSPAAAPAAAPAEIEWRAFITDVRLRQVVDAGLRNNRDLRVAVLNIERARALNRIERSALLPEVGAFAAGSRQRNPATTSASGRSSTTTSYSVELGLSGYELDFFGRVRNLSDAALENFYAVEENRRSTQISLVAEIASAWLTLAADTDRLQLANDTLKSQQASYELTRRTRELGGASGVALAQAQTTVDAARVDVARFTSQVAQDRNALELLAGARLPDELLPGPVASVEGSSPASLLVDVPAGMPAEVLQRRPDVLAAERLLRAANADIGAARAAFFPSITLTASAGTQSLSLANLFGSGSGAWSFVPQINLPIFDAGRRRANLQLSEAQQSIEVANYEKTLQVAFREVADALAQRGTLAEQLAAQQSLTEATQRSYTLSDALFKNGASSYLDVLDAQRSLYAARQTSITLRLSEQANRITLYRVLGGGWGGS